MNFFLFLVNILLILLLTGIMKNTFEIYISANLTHILFAIICLLNQNMNCQRAFFAILFCRSQF